MRSNFIGRLWFLRPRYFGRRSEYARATKLFLKLFVIVFYDDDISIYWNRSQTFNVWNNGKEVNSFTVVGTMTPKQAEQNADEWLADVLQEEKLRHADAF